MLVLRLRLHLGDGFNLSLKIDQLVCTFNVATDLEDEETVVV